MTAPEVEWVGKVRVPSKETRRKYFAGDPDMTRVKWGYVLHRQDGVCAICGGVPKSGILHIEHEHVRGWSRMAREDREKYIRGLVCQFCNRFVLARTMTLRKAKAIVRYLRAYEARKAEWE
jgi:hypothetical protein